MASKESTNKLFEAVNDGSDAWIDAIRAANDRAHRISTAVLQEVQEGQRESVELAKRWADAPLDIFGFYSAVIESTTKAQGRALDVTRQWFGEMADVQKETRQVSQRLMNANRTAGEAFLDYARGVFSQASQVISTNGDNRRSATREPAKADI
jgi:hypothetical protein